MLVDADALWLKTEQKTIIANMTSCLQFGQSPPTPTAVFPILAVEMKIINSDPHRQQEKRLVSTPIPGGETIWIHLDLLDDVRPWTMVFRKSSEESQSRQMSSSLPPLNPTLM